MADKVNEPAAPLALSTDKKQPPLMAVSVDVTSSPSPVSSMGKKKPSPPAVRQVSLYAFFNACIFVFFAIKILIRNRIPCNPKESTWVSICVELTESAAAEWRALARGQLWSGAAQAAAAALALLLMGRRRRWAWALAFAALAATAATHYMAARVDRIFNAAAHSSAAIVVNVVLTFALAVMDLNFLGILLGVGEE